MATATPADVRTVIDTDVDTDAIGEVLAAVERDVTRAYAGTDVTFVDDQHRADFEAVLTALRIVTGRDREVTDEWRGEIRVKWGASEVARLRARVTRLDPGGAFSASGGVVRDRSRSVAAVEQDRKQASEQQSRTTWKWT